MQRGISATKLLALVTLLTVPVAACGSDPSSSNGSSGSESGAKGGSSAGDASSGAGATTTAAATADGGSKGGGGATSTGSGSGGSYSTASESGVITYYAATGAGNCSFDATPGDLDVAAMDAPEYDDAAVCGECVAITGPKGELTVRVVDQCPECEKGHLDLSQEAFAKLADVSLGRVAVTWKVVDCDVTGPLTYRYKDGVSQYWFALQVENSRLPITSLEIKTASGFTAVAREDYNYFVQSSGSGTGAVTVRVTAADGQQLVDTLPPAAANVTSTGAAQFK